MSGPRFAIYFVPRGDTPLYRFGAAVLGYDCYTGETLPYPAFADADWPEITRAPRLYGFHATMKAPITLATDIHEGDLAAEFMRFADQPCVAPQVDLDVTELGGFVALVPRTPSEALQTFAADCVSHFDRFRAPLTADDLTRRRKSGLTARQDEFLLRWGYPYVFDEFRFHMTLTGQIGSIRRPSVVRALRENFGAQCHNSSVTIDHLALARQDNATSSFRVVVQTAIGG